MMCSTALGNRPAMTRQIAPACGAIKNAIPRVNSAPVAHMSTVRAPGDDVNLESFTVTCYRASWRLSARVGMS